MFEGRFAFLCWINPFKEGRSPAIFRQAARVLVVMAVALASVGAAAYPRNPVRTARKTSAVGMAGTANPWKKGVEAHKFDAKAKRDERLPWTPGDVAKLTGKPAGSGPGFVREAYKAVAAKFGRQAGLDWYAFILSKPTKFSLSDADIVTAWNDYGFKAFNSCDHSRVLEAIAALKKRGKKPGGDFAYRAVESVGLYEDLKTFPKDPASIVFPKENIWVKAKKTMHAKDFGWNPTDATACLQKVLDSDADTVVVDKMESPWLVVSVNVPLNKTIVFEDGVRVHATAAEQSSNSRKTLFVLKETVNHFLTALFACDIMRAYGYPPVGLEIQCGTIGDYPPILKEDLLACHMTDLAAGLKGINFYVFTGGPNMPGTGNTVDVYDYSAPFAADGTERPNYESLRTFGAFVRAHPELLEAERLSSVRLGFEWTHFAGCAKFDRQFMKAGVASALLRSPYAFEHFPLEGCLDAAKPLVLAGIESMSAPVQRKVAAFVREGGRLLVTPDFPRTDETGKPCAILAEAVGAPQAEELGTPTREDPVCRAGDLRVYDQTPRRRFGALPPEGRPTVVSEDGARVYGCRWPSGKGGVSQMGLTWSAKFFLQSDMLGQELKALGASPVVESSNRNVLTTAYRLKDGSLGVFALNLQSSPQETTVRAPNGASHRFVLTAMEVGYAKIGKN